MGFVKVNLYPGQVMSRYIFYGGFMSRWGFSSRVMFKYLGKRKNGNSNNSDHLMCDEIIM